MPDPKPLKKPSSAGMRLLLYENSTGGSKSGKTKVLWDSDPPNPAYFAEYAACYFPEHGGTLPPDFLETARRIDPQNAWFTYIAAGVKAKDAVKMRTQSKAENAANKTPEWDILDQTKLADAQGTQGNPRLQDQLYRKVVQDFRPFFNFRPFFKHADRTGAALRR